MEFGLFTMPSHPPERSLRDGHEWDLQVIRWADEMGFTEAWIGEHHSGGMEIIACPEMFVAAALERTRHIRLGTGVVSLPYHHPFLVADRDGVPRTMFKPDDGAAYWAEQKARAAQG